MTSPRIVIADEQSFQAKIAMFRSGGPERLQCVTDFDFTLTKFWSCDQVDAVVEAHSSQDSSSVSAVVSVTSMLEKLPQRVRLHSWYSLPIPLDRNR